MISTLKYGLLKQALLMGFSVMVVDLDIIFLKDPFLHLYRDAGRHPPSCTAPLYLAYICPISPLYLA